MTLANSFRRKNSMDYVEKVYESIKVKPRTVRQMYRNMKLNPNQVRYAVMVLSKAGKIACVGELEEIGRSPAKIWGLAEEKTEDIQHKVKTQWWGGGYPA